MALQPAPNPDGMFHSTSEDPSKQTTAPSVFLGASAPATTATLGFLNVPVMAGAPTGAPTAETGYCPIVIDSVNSKIWVRINGAWKGVVVA